MVSKWDGPAGCGCVVGFGLLHPKIDGNSNEFLMKTF